MAELFHKEREDWRLLRIYAWYRVALSVLLIGLFALKPLSPMLGSDNKPLFLATALGYFITTISANFFLRHPHRNTKTYGFMLLLIDLLVLTLMTHASAGLNTQIGLLFLVTVTAGNILLSGRMGALIAALASIAILYEQFYFSLSAADSISSVDLAQPAIFGISFFVMALFSQIIVQRMRMGEELAELRGQDIANLQQLNEQIVRRMRTGIIALSADRNILLSNEAAHQLLGLEHPASIFSRMEDVSLLLDAACFAWQQNPRIRPIVFRNTPQGPEISASFAALSRNENSSAILLFLEDTTQLNLQAQQMKLASLGRLTASIAHEIRNPLGAISHATQLLAESEVIAGPDRRLLEIIEQHCRRMNGVVENVLSVSRRQPSLPQRFSLQEWLEGFREEYLHQPEAAEIAIRLKDRSLAIRFDPQQLHQVAHNLVMNGLRYSLQKTGKARVLIEGGWLELNRQPYLDIIDFGAGITTDQQAHLFEPFFTTEASGTGLGLYLSREICEANQARLDYIPRDSSRSLGACFRITFAHPDRLS
ncbi:MAG: sensor histidine kinase [Moraxellaceae bacterium]